MYDWPECRAETDAEWVAIRDKLRRNGIDAPEYLTRRNADMPAVSGGIHDATGILIAPDPASLPPDELDVAALWRHPALLFAQTCWGPMEETGLMHHVAVLGQPDYSAFAGGEGKNYRSAVVMRRAEVATGLPFLLESSGKSARDMAANLQGKRLAANDPGSLSGVIALRRDFKAMGIIASEQDFNEFWGAIVPSGSHRQSVLDVAEGMADIAAIDCRSFHLAQRFEPNACAELAVVAWTSPRPGLPFICSKSLGDSVKKAFRSA